MRRDDNHIPEPYGDHYSPVWLEQANLVISLSYGTRIKLVYFEFAGFRKQKYMVFDRFRGYCPYSNIPTK